MKEIVRDKRGAIIQAVRYRPLHEAVLPLA